MSKPKGKHPDKALTAARVRSLKEPGRYGDGNGLYLVVDPSGAKRWMLRVVVQGKRQDIGLGGLKTVSLAEAREEAYSMRRVARAGDDPLAERRRQRIKIPTFQEAAGQVHCDHADSWKNKKHSDQWINTLRTYVFPSIGNTPVNEITTPDILATLSPIWLKKAETARRVKQRIGVVMDWAKAAGHFEGDNPISGVTKGLPKQPVRDKHHLALPYDDLPGFFVKLRGASAEPMTRLGFEFLILTATRTNEVINAKWEEINLKAKLWIIPAERMKARKEHTVPLSDQCVEILEEAKKVTDNAGFVFPSTKQGKPLSNMAFLMVLRRMKLDVTTHGFRSTFRDWASEKTNFSREVCEMALAHTIQNKAEAAYRRGDLLEKRRELMNTWANYATSQDAKVIPLRSGA